MTRIEAPYGFVEKYYTDDLSEDDSPENKFYKGFMKNIKGDKILDLGCGPNLLNDTESFSSLPRELVGIDLNKNNIEFLRKSTHPHLLEAKKKLSENKVKTELIEGDIFKPIERFYGYFDCVYAIGVVANFSEPKIFDLMVLVHRYLKPGGLFLDVSWTDNQLSEQKYKERLSYEWYSDEAPTIDRIGEIMKACDFKILKNEVYDVPNKKEYEWGKIYGYLAKKN